MVILHQRMRSETGKSDQVAAPPERTIYDASRDPALV
jgi:hypothetical protein